MKSSIKHLAFLLFSAAVIALATSACQTSKGFGEDVETLGEKIQDKAN